MILSTKAQNLVLWGASEQGPYITAKACYFDAGLSQSARLYNHDGSQGYKVLIPKEMCNRMLPGKTLDITFQRLQ